MLSNTTGSSHDKADDVVVLFSGGRDSSLTACLILDTGAKVHLLTFNDGSFIDLDISQLRVQEIHQIFPDNMVRRVVIPSYGLFRRIALANIESDFATYRKNLIILGSQLASHTEAILYCLRFNIKHIASGFTRYEAFLPEQMPESIELIRSFMIEYGIEYATPVYDFTDADSVKYRLFEMGISTKSLEAFSIFSDTSTEPTPQIVTSYIEAKLPICREYIASRRNSFRNYFKGIGRDE